MTMKNLEKIIEGMEARLDEKDAVRELALKSSRTIARLAGEAVRRIHRGEDMIDLLREVRDRNGELSSALRDHLDIYYAGYIENAHQELAEVSILHSIVEEKPLPTPTDLEVTDKAYLMGLGDVVGELRRITLDALKRGDADGANEHLQQMEEIFTVLMRFDFPSALLAIKRKQDIARRLLEKTRGEVAVASYGKSLEEKMDNLLGKL
ncbi:MAG: translin family protein [Candidatus Thermoplasmatota archaeon]|nr:translin family protein [Candidatus Thermoplasmatota archaeon]